MRIRWAGLGFVAALGLGCGSSTAGGTTGGGTGGSVTGAGVCTPGAQVACACVGGGQGAQVCAADGHSLEACQCGAGGAASSGTGTGGTSGAGGAGQGGSSTAGAGGGAGGSGGAGGCKNATGGPAPSGRYTVVDLGTGCDNFVFDGSGQVEDTTTGLVWDRYMYYPAQGLNQAQAEAFCQGQGARLPTKDEALAISGASYDTCAWPCTWGTWTSTAPGAGLAWHVNHVGGAGQHDVGDNVNGVLCVR